MWSQGDVEIGLNVRMEADEFAQVDGLTVYCGTKAVIVNSVPSRGARQFLCFCLPPKIWVGVDVDYTEKLQAALAETRAEWLDFANRVRVVDLGMREGEIVEYDGQAFGFVAKLAAYVLELAAFESGTRIHLTRVQIGLGVEAVTTFFGEAIAQTVSFR
jgi:hypothetical protein